MTETSASRAGERVAVRPLTESDLDAADAVLRSAFNTFVGVPDLFGDSDYVRTRFLAAPDTALAAEIDGELVGSNFVTSWGSFGLFGPLSVRPDFWERGVAHRLLDPTVELLDRWGVTHAGLFTFAHSPKHVALYNRYGFWPQYLTFIAAAPATGAPRAVDYLRFSAASAEDKHELLDKAAAVAGTALDGLDLRREIQAADAQGLGDTVLLFDGDLVGFAVCHTGPGSEAGTGVCYVKFGVVSTGSTAATTFDRLIDACFAYAAEVGAGTVMAGSNAARVGACRALSARGFRTQFQGVAMQRGNRPGFNRPDVYAIDDWR